MNQLEARKVVFYSKGDERSFFGWLEKIPAVASIFGRGSSIIIDLNPVNEADLREFIAIFHRYKVDMTQLAQFQNSENAEWFCDKKMFWYKRIFGSEKT